MFLFCLCVNYIEVFDDYDDDDDEISLFFAKNGRID